MKKLFLLLFIFLGAFALASCGGEDSENAGETVPGEATPVPPTDGESTPQPVEITKEMLEACVFKDDQFDYNGEAQYIYVEGVPAGVEVTYKNNGKVKPGNYYVQAILTYGDITVTKKAYLTINKLTPKLTADENQTILIYGGNVYPKYEIDNEEQEISYVVYKDGKEVSLSSLNYEGEYVVDIVANSSAIYNEKTVTVNVKICQSLFGLVYESQTVEYDGKQHSLTVEGEVNVPTGYEVVYENNEGTEVGKYFAYAYVKDAEGNIVETQAATLNIVYPKNEAFEDYLDSFFFEYLEDDLLSINIFCENPSKWGFDIASYDSTWYTYEPTTEEDFVEAKEYFNDLYEELTSYKDSGLSPLQQVAYNKVEDFLLENIALYEIKDIEYMRIVYVDSFGGYVADFATYMEAYSYRSEEDAKDIVDFIRSTETAFPSYVGFVEAKAEHGYGLTRNTVYEMINFLKDILDQGEDYYLADAICAKINASKALTAAQKEDYCSQVQEAMDKEYLNGVQALHDGLKEYLETAPEVEEGYWSIYETGKDLFTADLSSLLGFAEFDADAYLAELQAEFKRTDALVSDTQSVLVKKFSISTTEQLYKVLESYPIVTGTPKEMMEYLKEFAPHIVPNLQSEPEILIKEMDEASAKVSNAVAYYMKSALDNTGAENITLNPLKLGDGNDVLSTLAHEGYPGHLYSYVFSKEIGQHELSTIMTSTAHGEGWATYVALALYEYAMERTDDPNLYAVLDYLRAQELNSYLIYAIFDANIHLKGWTYENISLWLQKNYGYEEADGDETGKEIYNTLVEMPVTYAAYAYGKLYFVKLHDQAKQILGAFYNEVEFNAMLLSKGWTDLGELENTYNEYMVSKCHECGLEYTA